jgi:hypothetical protein
VRNGKIYVAQDLKPFLSDLVSMDEGRLASFDCPSMYEHYSRAQNIHSESIDPTLREEDKLSVFENVELRRIFESKG